MPFHRLKTHFLGLELSSPFILGSGPLSYDGEGVIRAHRAGAGAVTTKTIRNDPADNPVPHMALAARGTLINCEQWSDIPAARWIDSELPRAKDAGATVIASVGHSPAEADRWVPAAVDAGADAVELVSYEEDTLIPMVRIARAATSKPVLAKLSPSWRDPVSAAVSAIEAGADGITAMDSVGPALRIDIGSARPLLGGPGGYGWLSGSAIKPIILRYVAEIAARCGRPVLGLGGVSDAEDAAEMLMAGAAAIGICSAPIIRGVEYISVLNERLDELLDRLGYPNVASASGAALAHLGSPAKGPHRFSFYPASCTECRACIRCCPYGARGLSGREMEVDEQACRRCGLCASICPAGALRFDAAAPGGSAKR